MERKPLKRNKPEDDHNNGNGNGHHGNGHNTPSEFSYPVRMDQPGLMPQTPPPVHLQPDPPQELKRWEALDPETMRSGVYSKLTPKMEARILDGLYKGAYLSVIARAVHIRPETLRSWIKRGRDEIRKADEENRPPEGLHAEFVLKVDAVDAQVEVEVIEDWRNQTKGDFRAAQNFLAKRYRKRWGYDQAELNKKDSPTETKDINLQTFTTDEIRDLRDALNDVLNKEQNSDQITNDQINNDPNNDDPTE